MTKKQISQLEDIELELLVLDGLLEREEATERVTRETLNRCLFTIGLIRGYQLEDIIGWDRKGRIIRQKNDNNHARRKR